jgi:hypothetical protein
LLNLGKPSPSRSRNACMVQIFHPIPPYGRSEQKIPIL